MNEAGSLHALLNACLNGTSAILMTLALVSVRRGQVERHKKLMISAFVVSCVFLVSYLARYISHNLIEGLPATPFRGEGSARTVYFTILFSHMILAAIVPFGAIRAIFLGLKERVAEHRKLVRLAFPAWFYVSVTGVVIYLMLYHWPVPDTLPVASSVIPS